MLFFVFPCCHAQTSLFCARVSHSTFHTAWRFPAETMVSLSPFHSSPLNSNCQGWSGYVLVWEEPAGGWVESEFAAVLGLSIFGQSVFVQHFGRVFSFVEEGGPLGGRNHAWAGTGVCVCVRVCEKCVCVCWCWWVGGLPFWLKPCCLKLVGFFCVLSPITILAIFLCGCGGFDRTVASTLPPVSGRR